MIERPGDGNQGPSLRPSIPRARSQSRERSALAPVLKPNPPQGSSDGSRTSRTERGRSLGNDGPRRFHAPRSHSQSKLSTRANDTSPGPASCFRDPQPPPSDRKEDLRAKQAPPSSPRLGGGFSKRQTSSCTNSPIKGAHINNNSNSSKKTISTPRPPAPRPPSLGKNRLLPPVTSGGRRSPHSQSPRNSHHHPARLARTLQGPRSVGRGQHRNWSELEHQEPEEDDVSPGFQVLPTIDPQREQDLYRSFEAEFLANTQQARGVLARVPGAATPQGSLTPSGPAPANSNITDSAYSSSSSSTSSLNVGAKMGALPDLRESKRTNPSHLPLDDPLHVLYGNSFGGPHHFVQGEQWRECRGGLKKLPAISSSIEDKELSSYLSESDLTNQVPSQPAVNCRNMNGDHEVLTAKVGITNDEGKLDWDTEHIGDLENHQKNLPYDIENCDGSDDLPPPEACPSPVPFPPSEDCSFQDSSSESSSMCFSLSESHSESPQPSSPVANGDAHSEALSAKKGQKKGDKLDSLTKHKPRAKIRPRIDNRPENCPTRIPTPVSYRDLQANKTLSQSCTPPLSPQCPRPSARTTTCKILHPAFADMIHPQKHSPALGTKDRSYPGKSGSLGTDAWL